MMLEMSGAASAQTEKQGQRFTHATATILRFGGSIVTRDQRPAGKSTAKLLNVPPKGKVFRGIFYSD
jgi:hypothetical protein